MRFAIIIVTHNSARQLKRVVDKLNNGCFDFYIHISSKLDAKHYSEVLGMPNVYLIRQRVKVHTGGYSNLQATLNGINQILETCIDYSGVTLMSGREYPIKSAEYITHFLKNNVGKQFIKFDKNWHYINSDFTNQYHLIDQHFIGKRLVERYMNTFYKKPAVPVNLKIIGQSAYWTITLNCARYVATYIERYKFDRFLKYTKNSAHFVFQSIIMNSSFKESVVNNDYRYFDQPEDRHHPKVLKGTDFDSLISSDCLFARIFDIDVDEQIFDMIDKANQLKVGISA